MNCPEMITERRNGIAAQLAGIALQSVMSLRAALWALLAVLLLLPAEVSGQTAVRRGGHRHAPAQVTPVDSTALPNAADSTALPNAANSSALQNAADSLAQAALPDSIPVGAPLKAPSAVVEDRFEISGDSLYFSQPDTIGVMTAGEAMGLDQSRRSARNDSIMGMLKSIPEDEWVPRPVEFNPDPNRAVWLSALFPGLGQVYNRRYWKLPIIVGGYLGLGYATSWNNQMLTDYNRAYADIMDNDPDTKSYMDFFAPNVSESSIDKTWLTNLLRSRKNYFRRNRDLCIISMVGVYLLAMVDAYVDASLSHFDINPHLSMDVTPAVMQDGRQHYPSVGLAWALNF